MEQLMTVNRYLLCSARRQENKIKSSMETRNECK